MIDESLDVKEVVYSAERVSVIHDDELVSTGAPSTGTLGNCSYLWGGGEGRRECAESIDEKLWK